MTRAIAGWLCVLACWAVACDHSSTEDAGQDASLGPIDGGPVVDAGPCAQGNACGESPLPSECSGSETGECTTDFGCACATLDGGTCAWIYLQPCGGDAGTIDGGASDGGALAADGGAAPDAGTGT